MTTRSKVKFLDDIYCQLCSSSINKRLSSFTCDQCQLALCFQCHEKHSHHNRVEYFEKKRQLLNNFQEQCLRNLNATFDEIRTDLENLRQESIFYVQQQFHDAQIVLNDRMSRSSSQQTLNDLDHRLEIFSSPKMNLKMFTYPRHKLDLHCQIFSDRYASTKRFTSQNGGKFISSRCSCGQPTELESEKFDVETEIEDLAVQSQSVKQTQTDSHWSLLSDHEEADEPDEEEYFSIQDDPNDLSQQDSHRSFVSTEFLSQRPILTQHEVDRIASDGKNLLYFSETSKSLCYVIEMNSNPLNNECLTSKEIVCRWPHYSILDLIYSSASSQFVCATRTSIYTCIIDPNGENSTIDIQMQLTQHWSYVRLAADEKFLWIWTDTPSSSQLRIYAPKTFECVRNFDLHNYPRFAENSTSFCVWNNRLATLFQFKQKSLILDVNPSGKPKKYFHLTLSDIENLDEIFTVRLGECDIDHEIRAHPDGIFFITNGKRKVWIVDNNGHVEYVKLNRTGRALTVHGKNDILIANGTRRIQLIGRV